MRQELRDQMKKQIDELKTIRDEIRLDLHLATMDMKDEWREIERKLPESSEASKESARELLDRLGAEVRKFRDRLRDGRDRARVAGVMSGDVTTCGARDTLAHAVSLMWEHDLGFLPVVDRGGKLLGVLTDRDACIAVWSRGQRMNEILVETVMSAEPRACAPGDSCEDALQAMSERRVRRLPVVDGTTVVGVVSLGALARRAASHKEQANVMAVLTAVTEPRTPPAEGAAIAS
jgi:CBS domain-containing protein